MHFTKTILMTAILAATAHVNVQAAEEAKDPFTFSSNVGFTNNYIYRGISQTDKKMALQGGFDISHEKGFSLGVWGSSVKFLEPSTVAESDRAHMELDIYGGYTGKIRDDLNYTVGFIHYAYPSSGKDLHYAFTEGNVGLNYTYKDLDLGVKYSYSPEFFGKVGKASYYELNAGYKLPHDLSLVAHVARQQFNNSALARSYTDYLLGINYALPQNFTVSLQYVNTSLKDNEWAKSQFVAMVKKTF